MEFLPMITSLTATGITEDGLQSDYEVLSNIADINIQAINAMESYISNINKGIDSQEAFHLAATALQKDTQW